MMKSLPLPEDEICGKRIATCAGQEYCLTATALYLGLARNIQKQGGPGAFISISERSGKCMKLKLKDTFVSLQSPA